MVSLMKWELNVHFFDCKYLPFIDWTVSGVSVLHCLNLKLVSIRTNFFGVNLEINYNREKDHSRCKILLLWSSFIYKVSKNISFITCCRSFFVEVTFVSLSKVIRSVLQNINSIDHKRHLFKNPRTFTTQNSSNLCGRI